MVKPRDREGNCRDCGKPMPADYKALARICPACAWRRKGWLLEGAHIVHGRSRRRP